ncbi:MAG TPA: 16S rRNA (guanine(527)-N(7))-methyltransferase RsmG [Humisphaera sp.]|jgi:16S rRNA (guanine527-N7)-methyltransferase|nr:16S rRNA (guanine(527)-N(7))-methyltransferase RsmG [Humisphaera sp.]
MPELWNSLAARADVVLGPAQHEQFSRYLDLLFAANQTMNLTRIVDRPTAEVQHIGDSLTLLPYLPAGAISIADVGSGGGVPGIPLAIARPDATVLLIESTKKKAAFLRQAVAELKLANVQISDDRAEDVGHSARRESFDVVIARAVATLDWLAEWCLPLVKLGGHMLAMKGARAAEELPLSQRAIRMLGGSDAVSHPASLPGADYHVIVQIKKTRKSDRQFPRPASVAKGQPL